MDIKIKVIGLEKLKAYLKGLPRPLKIVGMRAASEFLVKKIKVEPEEKFVSRKSAYGNVSSDGAPSGYFSMKQFRYVAWLTDGFTKKYDRTHELINDWDYQETDSDWSRVKIFNQSPGAEYVMGEKQARQPRKVGWKKASAIMLANASGAIRAAREAINQFIISAKGK